MEKLGIPETQIFTCEDTHIDFSKPCIDRLEDYVLACIRAGIDPMEQLKEQDLSDKVIICMDIFCGVVPIDATMRLWRHTRGLSASIWPKMPTAYPGFTADWSSD